MANISILSRIVNGVQRQVDLSANTLVVSSLTVGGSSGTNLTQTVLGRLISLQNGTDVDATFHTHNTIYYTQTQLAAHASASGSGAKLIGDGNTYTHITPASTTVEDALLALDGAVGSAGVALDGTFVIENTTDTTKKIAFSAASISTGQTRTITMPDSNVNLGLVATALQASGSVTWTASQNAGGFNLTNLANAVNPQDGVTLSQMQTLLNGINWKAHVRAISASNITLSGTQTVDGVALAAGDRILVNGQTTQTQNGIYVVASAAWALATDANTGSEYVAAAVFVDEGTAYGLTAWVCQQPSPITIGTTAITFAKFASVTPYVFRNGLLQTGQNIDVVAGDTSLTSAVGSLVVNLNPAGAIVTSSGLKINLETSNPTLQIASNQLGVKLDAARAITTGAAGIGVNVDGTTIQIASDAVGIKPAGVSATQLATGAFDQKTIIGGAGTAAYVANAPVVAFAGVAGQALVANTTYAVRFGLPANSETAGSLYACDIVTSTFDLFWCVGFVQTTAAIAIGNAVTVVQTGPLTLQSADTVFGANDPGKPLFLQSGGINASTTAPSASGQAVAKLGIVTSTSSFRAQIATPYVA